jgi:predicted nucleic acid-binding protein
MIAVIDVSGVVEILLQREKADIFNKVIGEAVVVAAPDLFVTELTNTLWKYYAAKKRTKDECLDLINDGIDFINVFIDSKEMWEEAFSEGINNNHSIYDMFYMVAARRHAGILITNDSTLAAICKRNHIQVCC